MQTAWYSIHFFIPFPYCFFCFYILQSCFCLLLYAIVLCARNSQFLIILRVVHNLSVTICGFCRFIYFVGGQCVTILLSVYLRSLNWQTIYIDTQTSHLYRCIFNGIRRFTFFFIYFFVHFPHKFTYILINSWPQSERVISDSEFLYIRWVITTTAIKLYNGCSCSCKII